MITRIFFFGFLAGALVQISVSAQNYSIAWSKVAGGGGTCTGGVYTVRGTVGQPDASGAVSGGQYSVAGGFWAPFNVAVVQTPGGPLLTITHSGNSVTISWPFSQASTGFILQQNSDLANGTWSTSG
jgi:hypothetical protein